MVISNVSTCGIRPALLSLFNMLPLSPEASLLEHLSFVQPAATKEKYHANNLYIHAKLLHAMWIRELCARLPESARGKVHIHQVDPGVCRTALAEFPMTSLRAMLWLNGRSVETSARTVVNSCLPLQGSHGRVLVDYDVDP